MGEAVVTADRPERDRIAGELDRNLFVEAGAGSGKTSELVTRVVALVTSGTAKLESIAAITFTEKAGAELRDRVRQELERRAEDAPDLEVLARCREALGQLDGAAIGTLHSFAQRVLAEHPVEAGIPPRVEVLDEVTSGVEFERRWSAFRDELLADPALERTILLLTAAGVKPDALRLLATAFDASWDLVEERVAHTAPEPPDVRDALPALLERIDTVCTMAADCITADDRLAVHLVTIAGYARALRELDDEYDVLEAFGDNGVPKRPSFNVSRTGRKTSWRCDIESVRAAVAELGEEIERVRDCIAEACAHRLGAAIRRFTLAAASKRRTAGRLEFHDLLVLARALLRDPEHGPVVRRRLHERYRRLLLDEFQDTDPIQIELAVRIAARDPDGTAAGAARWSDVPVAPGQLFVVGDPKQSIYRFRRADISVFLEARARFGGSKPDRDGEADTSGDGPEVDASTADRSLVQLTANFRTVAPVIVWVNATFATLMGEAAEVDLPLPSQPEYVPLRAVRGAPPVGPPVAVVGREAHDGANADEMRAAEASDVVAAIVRAVDEGWSVDDGDGGWRPARLGDVTILVPARTSLPFLEDALQEGGIPYRTESSSLVYATRAVRDLLMVVRAVDDPTNHLLVVAALRTPLLGCGDDDLFRFKVERKGRWSYTADQPDSVPDDDPVRVGLAYLRGLHEQRRWLAPSELLDRIARDRRALELGFVEGRPRDVWRRLRFVVDQARGWSEATGGSLRQYLHWVDQQTVEGARVAESVLPETDDDAVRIMTIHAAKGLEFPVTIVSGMSTAPMHRRSAVEVVFPPTGAVGYRIGRSVQTEEFKDWRPVDEQMGYDERIRLLYVACTRARDHLVVSLHRRERKNAPDPTRRTNAELLLSGMGSRLEELPDADVTADAPRTPPVVAAPPAPPPWSEWVAERDAALARGARPRAVAATALTEEGTPDAAAEPDPGLQKRPRDLDLPPWLKGRYGTAVGRAVHGVLQTIDLGSGAGLDAAVAAQCEAEAVPDRAGDVRDLVRAALDAPSVHAAADRPHWREVYACTPIGDRLLEGYVDLLYRDDGGLVVVDYKTAATGERAELERRVEGYRLQGASYAFAVGAATDEAVRRVTFLFLTPDGAVELDLPDLERAVAEVRALVDTGQEVVVEQ
ncbi:MAG TPA: UvrD-helicase domain-containing protein [Acidimicrobiia bacterium]